MNDFDFGKNLAKLRKKKGVTQDEAALALGISNKTLSKWENGLSKPDISMLADISGYYRVSVEELLGMRLPSNDPFEEFISKEFSDMDVDDTLKKSFYLMDTLLKNSFLNFMPKDSGAAVPENMSGMIYNRSVLSQNQGYEILVNSKESNFFAALLGNESNFSWLSDEKSLRMISSLFEIFSSVNSLRICKLIHTDSFPEKFTAAFAANALDIGIDEVAEILEKMCKIKLCRRNEVNLSSGPTHVYTARGSGRILLLLSIAYDMLVWQGLYSIHVSGGSKMIGGAEK